MNTSSTPTTPQTIVLNAKQSAQLMEKLKAQGQEVQLIADTGDSILLEVTSQCQLHSCMKKSPSHKHKHVRLRFNFQECEE